MRDLKLHCRKVAQLILLIATKYIYYTHTPHIKRSRKLLKSQQRELSASLPSSVKTCTNFYDSNSLSFLRLNSSQADHPGPSEKPLLRNFVSFVKIAHWHRKSSIFCHDSFPPHTQGNHNHFALFGIVFLSVFCFCVEDFAQQNGKIARQNERVVKSGPISAPGSTTWPTCAGWWLATAGTNLAHSFWGEIIRCKCISDLAGR